MTAVPVFDYHLGGMLRTSRCLFRLSGNPPDLHADTVWHKSSTSGCLTRLCTHMTPDVKTDLKPDSTQLDTSQRMHAGISLYIAKAVTRIPIMHVHVTTPHPHF